MSIINKLDERCNFIKSKHTHVKGYEDLIITLGRKCDRIMDIGAAGYIITSLLLKGISLDTSIKKRLYLLDFKMEHFDMMDVYELVQPQKHLIFQYCRQFLEYYKFVRSHDLIVLDTYHFYGYYRDQLEIIADHVSKYILITNWRKNKAYSIVTTDNIDITSVLSKTDYTRDEINTGLGDAVAEFLDKHDDFMIGYECNKYRGLLILCKRDYFDELNEICNISIDELY